LDKVDLSAAIGASPWKLVYGEGEFG